MEETKKVEQIQDILKNLELDLLDNSIIQDNNLPFTYKGELYHVRMPDQKELVLAQDYADEVKLDIIQNKKIITRKKLIKLLKKQDINIEALLKQKNQIIQKIRDIYLSLATIKDTEKAKISNKSQQILSYRDQLLQISMEISQHLEPCIENKYDSAYMRYLSFACIEKFKDDKWITVWKNYKTFEADRTELPLYSKLYFSRLYSHVRSEA